MTLLSLVWVVVYAYRTNLNNIFITVGLFLCTVVFLPTTNYIFNSILKPHQQDRILSYLGIVDKPQGIDYNVNQSKIAIGSGGFFWERAFCKERRSSTASCPSGIPTSSSVPWAKSGALWGRWSCWRCCAC